jgi:hypothetical protein
VSDTEERLRTLLAFIDTEPVAADEEGLTGRLDRICRAAVRRVAADGAGITIMDNDGRPAGTMAASSARFRRLEEVQFTVGEGPCVEAHAARGPVLEPDVAGSGIRRWPAYAAAASAEGVNAVFAFPIQVGAARLGVLDLYRYDAGPLTSEALADALGLALICLNTLLAVDVTRSGGDPDDLGDALRLSPEAYQAQGAIMVQLGISLADAMVRLRARAYATNRPIRDVARDVLDGTIAFTGEDL